MTQLRTQNLTGKALDWAVAKAICPESFASSRNELGLPYWSEGWLRNGSPSTDWAQAGPLIDQYEITFKQYDRGSYVAEALHESKAHIGTGNGHLIAACRAIVAAELGEYVYVPDELV